MVLDYLGMITEGLKVHNAAVRHPFFGQANDPPRERLGAEAFFQERNELGTMHNPLGIGGKAGVVTELLQPECTAEARPLLFAHHSDCEILAILAEKGLMRHRRRHRTAHGARLFSGGKKLSESRCLQGEGG